MASLEFARMAFFKSLAKGTACPCCDRKAKIYRRSLTKPLVQALVYVGEYFDCPGASEWIHMQTYLVEKGLRNAYGGDFAKLRLWGFIESKRSKGSAGYWRLTEEGRKFLRGESAVARVKFLYNNVPIADPPEVERVTITQLLSTAAAA